MPTFTFPTHHKLNFGVTKRLQMHLVSLAETLAPDFDASEAKVTMLVKVESPDGNDFLKVEWLPTEKERLNG